MLNHIDLMGRLTRDPELRRTESGIPVASFTLAVDRDYCASGGERGVDFIDVVAWRGTAEFAARYFAKGRMAAVSGRLQIRNWQDREGNKRRSAEVVAESLYFGESKGGGVPAVHPSVGCADSSPVQGSHEIATAPAGPRNDRALAGGACGGGQGSGRPTAVNDDSYYLENDGTLPF